MLVFSAGCVLACEVGCLGSALAEAGRGSRSSLGTDERGPGLCGEGEGGGGEVEEKPAL